MKLNHRERLERTISGNRVDSIPVSFWHHFPVDDQNPESLSKATIHFQETFDFDFVKVMPPSSFCLKDWGANDVWNGNIEGTRDYANLVIKKPEDWLQLKVLDPLKGFLGKQIKCLKLIKKNIPSDTPIIQTIFNPLSQAKNLVGKKNLFPNLKKHPDALRAGLRTITETTNNFITECARIEIDGFFFAIQHASYDLLSREEFADFVYEYDSRLFESLEKTWLNMVHLHGSNIMFEECKDYPVQIFNWHDRDTKPDLKTGKVISESVVCGGLSRINSMVLGNVQSIRNEIEDAISQTGGKKLIIGTGCVLPLNVPYGNISDAVRISRSFS
jgi:uroporphyrinogen decarboxylase